MSSSSSQCNPRANVFLIINLGCEMLYVIDQRLQAQQIEKTKATQVFHEISSILLDTKFIDSIIRGSLHEHSQLLTTQHCRCMLNDIATRSLMRLDDTSMDKLWNLMTMVYKWQLFVSQHPHHLLDNTFRHLNSIAKLYANVKSGLLIDYVKNMLLDFWNSCNDETQVAIYRTNKGWLQCFNTKISLLIRLGFQATDGSFLRQVEESYFDEFVQSAGENVYVQSVDIAARLREELMGQNATASVVQSNIVHSLHGDLGIKQPTNASEGDGGGHLPQTVQQSSGVTNMNEHLPKSLLDMSLFPVAAPFSRNEQAGEFVSVDTVYNRHSEVSNGPKTNVHMNGLNKELLEIYNKMH